MEGVCGGVVSVKADSVCVSWPAVLLGGVSLGSWAKGGVAEECLQAVRGKGKVGLEPYFTRESGGKEQKKKMDIQDKNPLRGDS